MRFAILAVALLVPFAAAAESGRRIADRDEFVALVSGRDLTHFGVKLRVTGDGRITGRAFGRAVRGTWTWDKGFFCRTLDWGSEKFDSNCQTVEVESGRVRFTSDRGQGDYARLYLR